MAFKIFLAPTGTGNVVFEGDVINGYTTPDGKKTSVQFFSNDRGYTAANYVTDAVGTKALRQELQDLLDTQGANEKKFEAWSRNKSYKLTREFDGTPLILFFYGTDKLRGRSFHRGTLDAMKKILTEFDLVLKTIDDSVAGKGPEV